MTATTAPRTSSGTRNAAGRVGRVRLTAVAVALAGTFVGGILVLVATSQPGRLVGSRPVVPSSATLPESASFHPYELRAGRAATAGDEIVLGVSTALNQGIRLGDTVRLQGQQPGTFQVVGLVSGPGDVAPDASVVPLALGGLLVLAGLVVLSRSPLARAAARR